MIGCWGFSGGVRFSRFWRFLRFLRFSNVPLSVSVMSTDRMCARWCRCIEMIWAPEWRNLTSTSGKCLKNQIATVHLFICMTGGRYRSHRFISPFWGEHKRGAAQRAHCVVGFSVTGWFFKPLPLVLMRFLHSGAHLIAIHLCHQAHIRPVEMTISANGMFEESNS